MNGYTSLSRKEKYQQFFYLLLLSAAILLVLYFIFLRRKNTSGNELAFEMQLLEQKKAFSDRAKNVHPFLEKTFRNIDEMPLTGAQAFIETDIKNNINDIASLSTDLTINDPRKEGFLQIAQFYKMYFEDRKIAGKKLANIEEFQRQFTECSIGYKEKSQQLAQKNAASAARSN
ncbi:type VI secretion system TssO [Chitinophagaceae bacterium MMS25-I14]